VKPFFWLAFLFLMPVAAFAQEVISPGIVLPVRLESTLSSNSKPGEKISARVMQEVPLTGRQKIPVGSRLLGHVVSVTSAKIGGESEHGMKIVFVFDTLEASHHTFRLTMELRALASPVDVNSAKIPASGSDRASSPNSYATSQIGGEMVYRGGGHVMDRAVVVGEPVPGGVLGRLRPNSFRGCDDVGEGPPQALWLFSTNACGVYGYSKLTIVRTDDPTKSDAPPTGQIEISSKGGLKIYGGSGLLLGVTAADEPTS
jgi:hypothetical protein